MGRGHHLGEAGTVWGQGTLFEGSGHHLGAGDVVWRWGKSFVGGWCLSFVFVFMFALWALLSLWVLLWTYPLR